MLMCGKDIQEMQSELTMRRGFTLIELMVTLLIAAIVMSLAIPSFNSAIKNSRITSQLNKFTSSLYYARSEAVKRGVRVTVCKSTDGSTCVADGLASNWSQGWIVFTDLNNDATYNNAAETLLKIYGSAQVQITMVGNTDVRDYISYTANGSLKKISGAVQSGTVKFCDDRADNVGKNVVFGVMGRARVDSEIACP